MKPRLLLNLMAMSFIGSGALLTTFTEAGSGLNGLLWGALIAWFAAARVNGRAKGSS